MKHIATDRLSIPYSDDININVGFFQIPRNIIKIKSPCISGVFGFSDILIELVIKKLNIH